MKLNLEEMFYEDKEFESIIKELIENETVLEMKQYKQHYDTTCFDHCCTVAFYTYKLCKKFHLDYVSAARAGILHDLFLYDWRKRDNDRKGLHAFTHGKTACENASKLFDLNDKEKDMIIKHMWPVTVAFPKSFEGFLLSCVDKYCAISESLQVIKLNLFSKKLLRYTYVVLSFGMLNI